MEDIAPVETRLIDFYFMQIGDFLGSGAPAAHFMSIVNGTILSV
jgi:hypothetical protein